jgi:hypothetical protein
MQVESFSEIATIHDQALLNLICTGLEETGIPFLVEPAKHQRKDRIDEFKLFSPSQYEHQIARIIELSKREFDEVNINAPQQMTEFS